MSAAPSAEKRRRQAIVTAVALVVIGVVFAITWLINNHNAESKSSAASSRTTTTTGAAPTSKVTKTKVPTSRVPTSKPRTSAPKATSATRGRVPPNALATLKLIDAGSWPEAANAPGTNGGTEFRNNERLLPTTDAAGDRITYEEWDVNAKRPGRGRDAERIVTGSDGSAWYTGDHYETFVMIRGPNR